MGLKHRPWLPLTDDPQAHTGSLGTRGDQNHIDAYIVAACIVAAATLVVVCATMPRAA